MQWCRDILTNTVTFTFMPRKISEHLKKTWKKVVALKQADYGSWYSRARWKVQKPYESHSVVFNGNCKKAWWFFSCVLMNFYCYANEVLFSPPARWPFKVWSAYKTRSIFWMIVKTQKVDLCNGAQPVSERRNWHMSVDIVVFRWSTL